jgi:hypothetical protein
MIGVLLIPLVVLCLLTLANLLMRRYAAVRRGGTTPTNGREDTR